MFTLWDQYNFSHTQERNLCPITSEMLKSEGSLSECWAQLSAFGSTHDCQAQTLSLSLSLALSLLCNVQGRCANLLSPAIKTVFCWFPGFYKDLPSLHNPPPCRKAYRINSSNIFSGNHRLPITKFSGNCSKLILPEVYPVIALPIFPAILVRHQFTSPHTVLRPGQAFRWSHGN